MVIKNYYSNLWACIFICLFVHAYAFASGEPVKRVITNDRDTANGTETPEPAQALVAPELTVHFIRETDIELSIQNSNPGWGTLELHRSRDIDGGYVEVQITSSDDDSFLEEGLNVRTTYYYKCRFIGDEESSFSEPLVVTTLSRNYWPTVTAELINNNTAVRISLTDNSANDAQYIIEDISDAFAFKSQVAMPDSGQTVTFVHEPVRAGYTYRYIVSVMTYDSPPFKYYEGVTLNEVTVPETLATPDIHEWYIDQNDLAFDISNNNGRGFTELYRASSADGMYELIQTVPHDEYHIPDEDLNVRAQYFYKWRAVDGEEYSPFSEPFEIHTQSITYFPRLYTTTINENTIEITFKDESRNDIEYVLHSTSGSGSSFYEQFSMPDSGRIVTFRHENVVPGETYTYTVDLVTDNHPTEGYHEAVVTVAITIPGTSLCAGTGVIRREIWTGVPGTEVSSIPVNEAPDQIMDLTLFETSNYYGNEYGARIRGYLCPPVSGLYTFYIASDDKSELWLSPNESPAAKVKIAEIFSGYTKVREWNKYMSQHSYDEIYLEAGQRYYIEALHKEGNGADHLSVGWDLPDGTTEAPIPGYRLIPFDPIASCEGTGKIRQEFWTNVSGTDLSTVSFDAPPNNFKDYSNFETQQYYANNYGSRMRAYICVPLTGDYTFWISSDDMSQLYLSTDDQPANKQLIASVTGHTAFRQYEKYSTQESSPIYMEAGRRYYIEALHKEANGNDFISVGWRLPDGQLERPIPGNRLIFIEGATPNQKPVVNITSPADGATLPSGNDIIITADASDADGAITKVEFFLINQKIGEDLTAPYQVVWNDPQEGETPVRAIATDNSNATATDIIHITVSGSQACEGTGTIVREIWTGIPGTSISSVPFDSPPDITTSLTLFGTTNYTANEYGSRIRAYLCVPESGAYTFYIASDDNSELWLSTSDDTNTKTLIASLNGAVKPGVYTKYASQVSAPVNLISGQKYYIEALHKEGNGADHLSVAWRFPNGDFEGPIPGSRLIPYSNDDPAARIAVSQNGESPLIVDDESYGVIKIFPNPTLNREVTIVISGVSSPDEGIIQVVSSSGKIVFKERLILQGDLSGFPIRLGEHTSSGIYFVSVISGRKRWTKKLVIE